MSSTTAPEAAVAKGHTLEWDPPAAMTAALRWTCSDCESSVIDYRGNVYGSATEKTCEQAKADDAEFRRKYSS
jgi:hypothetical protein